MQLFRCYAINHIMVLKSASWQNWFQQHCDIWYLDGGRNGAPTGLSKHIKFVEENYTRKQSRYIENTCQNLLLGYQNLCLIWRLLNMHSIRLYLVTTYLEALLHSVSHAILNKLCKVLIIKLDLLWPGEKGIFLKKGHQLPIVRAGKRVWAELLHCFQHWFMPWVRCLHFEYWSLQMLKLCY